MTLDQDMGIDSIDTSPPKRWGQERRLEFIDYRLRWDRHINRSDLTSFFGISVPQASLDITEYSKRAPNNLVYDSSTKVYLATIFFEPVFASSALECYLDDLLRVAINPEGSHRRGFLGWHPPVATIPRPWRRLDAAVAILVVKAIRHSFSLRVHYQSFSGSELSTRTLTPHALVNDGYRWHMRAYCHRNGDFRDFLLSRIIKIEGSELDRMRGQDDQAWHNIVKLVLMPHPDLVDAHRAVIELDYGMEGGECSFECRQALMFYALQQLGLSGVETGKSAKAQQIILKNREDLAAFLPKTKHR